LSACTGVVDSTRLANYQYEVLGYVDRTDPKLEWRYACITNLNTTYSPKFNAYCIQNGKITEMKVHKAIPRNDKRCKVSFKQVPFEEGEIIYIKDCKKEPKKIKVDDEWQIVPDTYEWWIKDYCKVVANEKKEVSDS
jgi:DNA polymerase-3 subunit alpha